MSTTTTNDPQADLDNAIKTMGDVLNGNSPAEGLKASWRFLQIYSSYGLKLPVDEARLKMELGTMDFAKYPFATTMLKAYGSIREASLNFNNNIFPKVIQVGRNVLDFAKDANPDDGGVFGVLEELVNTDPAGALELIGDLQKTTATNIALATEVETKLQEYGAQLTTAQAELKAADDSIAKDSALSQADIDKLMGDENQLGSIANFKKLIKDKQAEYDHDVVVAATSPTYVWVIPYGTIAAVVVAGVYGDRAVKALNAISDLEAELKTADANLFTALQTHKVQEAANKGVDSAVLYTHLALAHTVNVKNAWSGVKGSLDAIGAKVNAMTKDQDGETKLKVKQLVINYAQAAGKSWALLIPPLKILTTDPYIVVDAADVSAKDLAATVQKEITKQAAA
jgi:hypothetical protein